MPVRTSEQEQAIIDHETPRHADLTGQRVESRLSRIARRAHEIYEARGGEQGKALDDWLAAEREIDDEIDRDGRSDTPQRSNVAGD